MATDWFWKSGENEQGPFAFRDLIELARTGTITRTDFVRSNWHKDWQPANAVLEKYFAALPEPRASEWSETVHAALAARSQHTHRDVRRQERRGVSLGWLARLFDPLLAGPRWLGEVLQGSTSGRFGWLADFLESLSESAWPGMCVRLLCAVVCAGVVALMLDQWSTQEALTATHQGLLQKRRRGEPPPPVELGRPFPLVGRCGRELYLFLLFDTALAAGAVAYFVPRWLESSPEESS